MSDSVSEQQQQQQQEKEAEWICTQAQLAAQLHLPRTELFDLPTTDSTAVTASRVCCVDGSFVNTDFILPRREIEAAFATTLDPSAVAPPCPLAQESPNFLRQLQHDYTRQQQAQADAPIPPLEHIAGLDISFVPGTNLGVACCVVLRFPSLEVVRTYFNHCELREPYVSGFLAFREVEPVLALFRAYREELLLPPTSVLRQQQEVEGAAPRPAVAQPPIAPQLLFLDGCGVLHPRRCGLASHLGALLDLPTIGISKKMLVVGALSRDYVAGLFQQQQQQLPLLPPPPAAVGAKGKEKKEEEEELFRLRPLLTVAPLAPAAALPQLYGYALQQTPSLKKCIYVSPGNRIGYALAVALVRCVSRHRIPEPTRQADLRSREYIRQHFGSNDAPK